MTILNGRSISWQSQYWVPREAKIQIHRWETFVFKARLSASLARTNPRVSQVGACIVNKENKIVGIGYNGFPKNCPDDALPWSRKSGDGSILNTKYPFVCHAEMNAILNKNEANLNDCTMFVSLFPCNECAKLIIQSGIRKLVYLNDQVGMELPVPCAALSFQMVVYICLSMLWPKWWKLPKSSFVWLESNWSISFRSETKSPLISKNCSVEKSNNCLNSSEKLSDMIFRLNFGYINKNILLIFVNTKPNQNSFDNQ